MHSVDCMERIIYCCDRAEACWDFTKCLDSIGVEPVPSARKICFQLLIGGLIFGIKIFFFWTYGSSSNPDPEMCWVIPGDKQVYAENPADEDGDSIDYGDLFRRWFRYGAIIFIMSIVMQIIAMVGASSGE